MRRIPSALLLSLFILGGCSVRSDFEDFAYQGCLKEGKYPDKICACNAKNLDQSLSDDEKSHYKKAALGDTASAMKLMSILGKLSGALRKCAE